MKRKKIIKNKCEIETCNITDSKILHLHHIIERTEINTSNDYYNLAILCPNHHAMTHSGKLEIIGIFPSTKPPNNRILVYKLDGYKNIDIDEPYLIFKNKSYKLYGDK